MAKVSMALAELVEKGAQDDVVREFLSQRAGSIDLRFPEVAPENWTER